MSKKIVLIILGCATLIFSFSSVHAQVIFQDNFDSSANWTVTQPIGGENSCWSGCSVPGSWTGYLNAGTNCGSNISGRPGNNSLYISSYADTPTNTQTCRGGIGKCFTHWMENCLAFPQFDDADGILGKDLGSEYEEVYVRIYIRFPTSFKLMEGGMFKIFHVQHWNGDAVPWNYFERDTNNQPVAVGGPARYGNSVFLYHNARCYSNYNCYGDILWKFGTTTSVYAAGGLFDGNWHSIEMRYKRNSAIGVSDGLIEAWFDGVKMSYEPGYEANAIRFTDTGSLRGFRFISIGGNNTEWGATGSTMAGREQWYAIDDVVVSTNYIGPIGPPPPGQAPSPPTGLTAR